MPVYTIETPSGHRLDIDAKDEETAVNGAKQWHADQQPSGAIANAQQGTSEAIGGIGKTLQAYMGDGYGGQALQDIAAKIAPANFVPSPIYDEKGFHASGIVPSLARIAPAALGTVAGAALAPEAAGTAGAVAGAAGAGWLMGAGNSAQHAADNRAGAPNAPITTPDLVKGGAVEGAKDLIGGLVVPRYLSKLAPGGTAASTGTGLAGVNAAAKNLGATVLKQAGASGAQDVVGSVGLGDGVNPTSVVNSALTGGVAGGMLGTRPALRDTLNAVKYSGITPDLQGAAAQYTQLADTFKDNRNLDAGWLLNGKAKSAGEDVYQKTAIAAKGNLTEAIEGLQNPLPRPAQAVIDRINNGKRPTPGDYNTLQSAIAADPNAQNVMDAARIAHVSNIVGDSGIHSDGKFSGGIAGFGKHVLTGENVLKTGLVATAAGLGAEHAGHLIAYSPTMIGGVAAAGIPAVVLDHLTGAAAPMGRFMRNFPAGGASPPAGFVPPVQSQPAPTAAPWGPRPVQTVPTVPQAAPAAPPAINPLALPTSITAPAKNIVGGIQKAVAARAAYEGALAAKSAVANSPFIEQKVGGAENVPTPAAAKEMAKAVSGASVLAKLQSDPAASAAEKVAAKAEAAQVKAQAKAATVAAKAVAPAPKITAVTKTDGKIGTGHTADAYVVPTSPYGHMEPASAAKAITEAAMKSAQPPFKPEKFQAATQKNLESIWDRARAIASESPGVDPKAIYSQFAGVATKKQAMQHRDWLMKHMPQAAASIGKFFPDADINGTALQRGMWNR